MTALFTCPSCGGPWDGTAGAYHHTHDCPMITQVPLGTAPEGPAANEPEVPGSFIMDLRSNEQKMLESLNKIERYLAALCQAANDIKQTVERIGRRAEEIELTTRRIQAYK